MHRQYTETISLIIPNRDRDNMGVVASYVTQNEGEQRAFDSIELSPNGLTPVTHLMTYAPATSRQVSAWLTILGLTSSSFPKVSVDETIISLASPSIDDPYFLFVVSKRYKDGILIKTKPISIVYPAIDIKAEKRPFDVFSAIGLLRVYREEV